MSAVKDAVLALFEPSSDVLEPAVPVAPSAEIELVICPHCDCPECEIWSTTEARMANCPECGAMFSPNVMESKARTNVTAIFERRMRLRRQLMRQAANDEPRTRDEVKTEIFRMLPQ